MALAPLGYVRNKSRTSNKNLILDDEERLRVLNSTAEEVMKKMRSLVYAFKLQQGRTEVLWNVGEPFDLLQM